jgi:BlaI family penicillinase repressor
MALPARDLPQSQLQVMEVLWQKREATIREVFNELTRDKKLSYPTVGTLLYRLRDAGYVKSEERDSVLVFRPLVQREDVQRRKVNDLVRRVLGGDATQLALYMANSPDLTPELIQILDGIVKSAKSGKGEDHER